MNLKEVPLKAIVFYNLHNAPTLNIKELASYIRELLPPYNVEIRSEFIQHHLSEKDLEKLALEFTQARVKNPSKVGLNTAYLPGEADYERKRLSGNTKAYGVPYEGFTVMFLYRNLIAREERGLNFLHIAFIDQLLATWEETDKRYHLRAALYGFPSIISTSGLVEAPAKPREYYLLKSQYQALGAYDAAPHLEEKFRGRYLAPEDLRLTEVAKGYILQALAYHVSGDPFCSERKCRLYNAHWQEEMLQAQLGERDGLCPEHQELFSRLARAEIKINSG